MTSTHQTPRIFTKFTSDDWEDGDTMITEYEWDQDGNAVAKSWLLIKAVK